MKEIDLEKLKLLNLPVCDIETLQMKFGVKGKIDNPAAKNAADHMRMEIEKEVNEYLKIFVAPIKVLDKKGDVQFIRCLNCNSALTGLFGTFKHGLTHGEGYCSKCGYPGRMDHRITRPGWNINFGWILQYQPKYLKKEGN